MNWVTLQATILVRETPWRGDWNLAAAPLTVGSERVVGRRLTPPSEPRNLALTQT